MSCDRRYDVELFAADEDHAVFWLSEDDCRSEGPDRGEKDGGRSEGPDASEGSEASDGHDTPVWNSRRLQTSDASAM